MKIRNTKYILLIALVIGIFASCKKDSDDSGNLETAMKVGALAPGFELADTQGNLHKLSDYRGSYVVVDFWAAWCSYCRTENPIMQDLHEEFESKGLVIIGVSLDKTKEAWLKAIDEDQLSYIQLGDQEAFDSDVAATYGITSIPFMMLLNPEGKILTFSSRVNVIEARVEQELK